MVLGVVRADGESSLFGGIGERMALLDVLLDGRLGLAQRLEHGADARLGHLNVLARARSTGRPCARCPASARPRRGAPSLGARSAWWSGPRASARGSWHGLRRPRGAIAVRAAGKDPGRSNRVGLHECECGGGWSCGARQRNGRDDDADGAIRVFI